MGRSEELKHESSLGGKLPILDNVIKIEAHFENESNIARKVLATFWKDWQNCLR